MLQKGFRVLAALVALLTACSNGDLPVRMREVRLNTPGSELQPENVMDVPKQLWRVTSASFRRPFAVRVLGDSLAVVLDRAEPFMHLIDVRRGLYLYPLVPSPEDNLEPVNVYRIAPSPRVEREFIGYDLIGSTLTTFRIGPEEKPLTALNTIRLSAIDIVDSPVWHTDGSVSVEPMRENSLRARVLPTGELASHTGIGLSELRPNWVPAGAWRDAMEGHTCPHPARDRLARVFQFMGQVMVLDSLGAEIDDSRTDRFFAPSFDVRSPTGEVVFAPNGGDVRLAYRSCGATRRYVFGLFSGRRMRLSERASEMTGRQIHVYDWRARLLGGFMLARETVSMDITPDGQTAVVLEASQGVTGYSIPRAFRTR